MENGRIRTANRSTYEGGGEEIPEVVMSLIVPQQRYDWPAYSGRLPIAFSNSTGKTELLRQSLGLFDPSLVHHMIEQGVNFALCSDTSVPSKTLSRWYPYASDEWARHHFGTTYDQAWGWYREDQRAVIAAKGDTVVTITHEVGHVVDGLLGSISSRYFRPGYGVTSYAEKDSKEFWAEAFEQWCLPWGDKTAVRRAHPDFPELFANIPDILQNRAARLL